MNQTVDLQQKKCFKKQSKIDKAQNKLEQVDLLPKLNKKVGSRGSILRKNEDGDICIFLFH